MMPDCSLDTSDWETIQKYTLVLTGPSDNVLSFGPLWKPWEWWLTLKTESSRHKLLLAGGLKVGKGGHLFHVRSAAKT